MEARLNCARIILLLFVMGTAGLVPAQDQVSFMEKFNKPVESTDEGFGYALAAVGTDRLLISAYRDDTGAPYAGVAHLFSLDGALLLTITNPTPAYGDSFGNAVAAVGNDRLLIAAESDNTGAPNAGSAYLFSTGGELLLSITNPAPSANDLFGYAIAALGNDRLLIGAPGDDAGGTDAGAAYLFDLQGQLLSVFDNPEPGEGNGLGYSVAAIGPDVVAVGAPYYYTFGVVYLYSTNGAYITTITNPTPINGDMFGVAMAGVGDNHLVIGATGDDTGASDGGAAYVFSRAGLLVATLTKPGATTYDAFGIAVAGVGNARVLVGATGDDSVETGSGGAYLFGIDGTFRAAIKKPNPQSNDSFGNALAAVGSDRVLVGAFMDSVGTPYQNGAAYLYALMAPAPPGLAILPSTGGLTISWSPDTPGFVLQETSALLNQNWTNSPSGSANPTVIANSGSLRLFRLTKD